MNIIYRIEFELYQDCIPLLKAINQKTTLLNIQYERIGAIRVEEELYKVSIYFDNKISKSQFETFIKIIQDQIIFDLKDYKIINPIFKRVIYEKIY